MAIRVIFDPHHLKRPMRVACFLSGSGTNATKIIERQGELDREGERPYEVVLLFSDTEDPDKCRIRDISEDYAVPHIIHDMVSFYKERGRSDRKDLALRPEYDQRVAAALEPFGIDLIVLAGYMSIVTQPLLTRYSGRIVNVHPADLSLQEGMKRKYTGLHAVRDAILAGEGLLHATTHVVRERVDQGEILMISEGVRVVLPQGVDVAQLKLLENSRLLEEVVSRNQTSLKEKGDWVIYPLTLQWIGQGRFALDDMGSVYLDGKLVEGGFRLG